MTQPTRQDTSSRRTFLRTTGVVAGALTLGVTATRSAAASRGVRTANGWYEEEEIYYIDQGLEEGVTERGENDIYLIGGDRVLQAQVVEFIPGERGYSPHWNANLVNTAAGVTVADIAASPYVSEHYPEALFDDVADIRAARDAGLVTITKLGVVVLCPIISEEGAEAPGNTQLSEDFPRPWPETF
ncbi:hypothetical protein [Haladaptatus sp. ZSTT2]|uniref:hypothetical protein n=1 Tax=Haladaptatus sp. ZSTT2 TaxID=3120515 RepID=UPI00300EB630